MLLFTATTRSLPRPAGPAPRARGTEPPAQRARVDRRLSLGLGLVRPAPDLTEVVRAPPFRDVPGGTAAPALRTRPAQPRAAGATATRSRRDLLVLQLEALALGVAVDPERDDLRVDQAVRRRIEVRERDANPLPLLPIMP